MPRARARVRKDARAESTSKSLPSGVPEGGVHVHMLERELKRTKTDGAHFHIFRMPDGTFFSTLEDGRHGHDIDGEWTGGGDHAHRVATADGETLTTQIDGWHSHDLQTDSTAFDGTHTHKLMLPDGTTIESLLPAQHYLLEGSPAQINNPEAPPASALAKSRGPVKAEASLTKEGRLEIRFADRMISVAVSRSTINVETFDESTFTTQGSDQFYPLVGLHADVLDFNGGSTDLIALGEGTAEVGLLTEDQQEFFLNVPTKDGSITGTLKMVRRDGMWIATLATDAPNVLRSTSSPMPPLGCSALPASLEADIPTVVRYWEKPTLVEAKKARDWLVETGYFTHEAEVRLVGDHLRKVHVERRYFAHTPEVVAKDVLPAWPQQVANMLPTDVEIVSPFAEADWQAAATKAATDGALIVLDPPSTADPSPQDLVDAVKGAQFLLVHEDTPEARDVFAKAGQPFKMRDPAAAERLFVASFPVVAKSAVWVEFAPAPAAKASAADFAQAEDEAFARVSKRLDSVRVLCADDDDDADDGERFVYGIAMEPDEVDSQGDTQTAETIRVAAHKFMEDYGNIGLQHSKYVNGKVKILESALLPFGGELGGQTIKANSWIFAVRVLDDDIWVAVKSGDLTGFSIGGVAVRDPV